MIKTEQNRNLDMPEIPSQTKGGGFWRVLNEQILSNKIIVIATVLSAILCYGFAVTNFSVGVDDPAAWHYLHSQKLGSMIQQGRLAHVVLEALTGHLVFQPFFNEFIAVVLFVLSAWVLCGVFQYVTHNAFSAGALASFCAVYLSYSIVNEKFIYNLDVIVTMLSYLSFAFSLLYSYQFVYEGKKLALIWAILWQMLSIASYESFLFLYITGVFFLVILKIFINGEQISVRDWFLKGMKFALVLIVAAVLYYGAVVVVQKLTHQFNVFHREPVWVRAEGFAAALRQVMENIYQGMSVQNYFPVRVYSIALLLGTGLFLLWSIYRKTVAGIFSYAGFLLSNFLIHFFTGQMLYRAAQGNCFWIAAVVMCGVYLVEQWRNPAVIRWGRKVLYGLVVFFVLLQAADLNQWFYNDYARYKKEEFAIHMMATELVARYDYSKPVVFVNPDYNSYLNSWKEGNQANGSSCIQISVGFLGETSSETMIDLFNMHGYYFLREPTEEQTERGMELSKGMAPWPEADSIREYENIIVVNFARTDP